MNAMLNSSDRDERIVARRTASHPVQPLISSVLPSTTQGAWLTPP